MQSLAVSFSAKLGCAFLILTCKVVCCNVQARLTTHGVAGEAHLLQDGGKLKAGLQVGGSRDRQVVVVSGGFAGLGS